MSGLGRTQEGLLKATTASLAGYSSPARSSSRAKQGKVVQPASTRKLRDFKAVPDTYLPEPWKGHAAAMVGWRDPYCQCHTQVQTCCLRGCVQDVARRAEIQNQATLGHWQESPSCPSSWSFPLAPRGGAWPSGAPALPSSVCPPIQSQRPTSSVLFHPPHSEQGTW